MIRNVLIWYGIRATEWDPAAADGDRPPAGPRTRRRFTGQGAARPRIIPVPLPQSPERSALDRSAGESGERSGPPSARGIFSWAGAANAVPADRPGNGRSPVL